MLVPKVIQVFPSVAGNCFSSPQRQQNCIFPEHTQLCATIQEFKRIKKEKKPTQILQVINSGKTAEGILHAMGVAFTNIFPDPTHL